MNKSELINAVAEKAALSKKDSEAAVAAALDAIAAALAEGDEVRLVGFGTFEVKHRKARMGRNPKDPEKKIERGLRQGAGQRQRQNRPGLLRGERGGRDRHPLRGADPHCGGGLGSGERRQGGGRGHVPGDFPGPGQLRHNVDRPPIYME